MEILNEMIRYPGSTSGWVRIIDSREREAVKAAMLCGTITFHSYAGGWRHHFDKFKFTHDYALKALERNSRSNWNLIPFAYVYLPEKQAGCYEALAIVENLVIQIVSFFCPPLKIADDVFGPLEPVTPVEPVKTDESFNMNERHMDSWMAMAKRNQVKPKPRTPVKKVPDGSVTDGNILSNAEAIDMFKKNYLIRGKGQDPRTKLDMADCYVLFDEQREYNVIERAYSSIINMYGIDKYQAAKENSIKVITTAMREYENANEPFEADAPVVGEEPETPPVDESVKYSSFNDYINKNS